jgi:nucleotide-binding universal stress UspA family protein
VLHVDERDVVAGEDAIDLESTAAANALLEGCVAELREAGVPVVGELLHSVGGHADVAARILARAAELGATTIVVGPETHHGPLVARVSAEIAADAPTHVIVLHPEAGPLGRHDGGRPAVSPARLWRTSQT